MVIGIGLDLVEMARVERALARHGERFVGKLMDPGEAAALPPSGPERGRALAFAVARESPLDAGRLHQVEADADHHEGFATIARVVDRPEGGA